MKSLFLFLVAAVLLLTGCNQLAETNSISGGGGAIEAVNHTHWTISHLSASGQSGVDIIGPWQGGGGAGYFGVPPEWELGMTVRIDWKTGVGDMDGFPGFDDGEKLLNWYRKMRLLNREHSLIVPVPNYNSQRTCDIRIRFLSYDKIKVTTSCYNCGNSNYPIKSPIKMEEPEVCPR